MVGSDHLTGENVFHLATKPGQAHFAADINHTCRECEHWANQRGERTRLGLLKEARCRKALQHLPNPPPVAHTAWACRHFTPSPNPPPA
jgi:hypothetical protein